MALILLAEEETSTIDHVRSVLASQGWLVKTVKSRAQALRAASEFAPQLVLLNDELKGVDDLVRTFSRRSGGPGVVLLSTHEESPTDGEDIEAVLTKPVQTEELIETIKNKLSTAADRRTSTDAGADIRIFSSEEIFGDLLDDILDKHEPETTAAAKDQAEESTEASEAAPTEEVELEEVIAVEGQTDEVAEAAEPVAAGAVDDLADLSDLEELAKQTVPALVDAVEAQARQSGEPEERLDVAELLRETAPPPAPPEEEPPPPAEDLDEDLEAKLSDTLAGVLAASLGAASEPGTAIADDGSPGDVNSLLSQALSDLDIGGDPLKDTPVTQPAADAREEAPEEKDEPTVEAAEPETEVDQVAEEVIESVIEEEPQIELEPKPVIEFGEYTLEERIGIGGMAEVWKARRKGVEGFEKRVAIKKILPQPAENQEFVDMFIDEAKLAAQLNHQNITHIYDLGKVDDDYFIAMEYVGGQNLRQLLDALRRKDKPLSGGLALYIASRIADALDYAHRSKDFNNTELGLVHRDVSPQNVLISQEGDIKLCDFGIAKAVSKISTTQMGALKGKLQYMSPEQAWGRSIDHRSDIFSTGTLLFEMLTGERLFIGESELSVLESVRECETAEKVIQNPAIPSRTKGLLLKALAKDPEERFDSAGELLGGLEELLAEFDPTPGQRELGSFVCELLDLPEEAEPVTEAEGSAPQALPEEIAEEAPEPAQVLLEEAPLDIDAAVEDGEPEEVKRQSVLLKWLSRLLPVVAVVAIGGYLIFDRMGQEPASDSDTATLRFAASEAFRPEAVEPSLPSESGIDADTSTTSGQRPQAAPTPASRQQTSPAPIESPQPSTPATVAADEAIAPEPGVGDSETEPIETAGTDPELQRRVEEDLQRVQELISTPDFAADSGQGEDLASEPPAELTEPTSEELGFATDDLGVTTDDTGPLIQGAGASPEAQDDLAETSDQGDEPISLEPDLLETAADEPEGAGPLSAEGGEPPETSSLESEPAAADSSPDLPIASPTEGPSATQSGDLVEPGPGVTEPQVLSFRPPAYSPLARRIGAAGTVRVAVLVDENGRVTDVRLVQGLPQKVGLDEQTLEAARRATFRPATKDGVPVKMWHELAVQFQP